MFFFFFFFFFFFLLTLGSSQKLDLNLFCFPSTASLPDFAISL
jgi:hypothetical protein